MEARNGTTPAGDTGAAGAAQANDSLPVDYTTTAEGPCPCCGEAGRYRLARRIFRCRPCRLILGADAYSDLHALRRRADGLERLLQGTPLSVELYQERRRRRELERDLAELEHGLAEGDAARDALRRLVVEAARGTGWMAGAS